MFFENASLYQLHELQHASVAPLRAMANASKLLHRNPMIPTSYTHYGRSIAAAAELVERITHRYPKPQFGITHTEVGGKPVEIHQETLLQKPFCNLVHFKKVTKKDQPKLLVVAPMSGHHATLLRGTVESLLPHADVYITDWLDARNVPLFKGKFDLDDYISYVIEFMETLGPDLHVMAVCQPAVPVFAAATVLNARKSKSAPKTMTLIGGPIDAREAPTKVNKFAMEHSMSWFESHVVTRVPFQYPGFMRRVYPGFLQLTGFISMNAERHFNEHVKLFQHLVVGDGESASQHKKFYNEYLAVADLPAEFYLETIDTVFHKFSLPNGTLDYQGELVDPKAITKTAILCLEGELDDISGLGQTKAALKIASKLPSDMKKYHMEPKVGHYGIFNGKKFRENVVPIIAGWMKEHG